MPTDTTIEYRDYTITLTNSFKFRVEWDLEEEEYDEYESLDAAKKSIDAQVAKDKRKKRKVLSIPIIRRVRDGKRTKHTLTGQNSRTGVLLLTPKADRWGSPDYYLDHPHVQELLEDVQAKREALNALERKLDLVKIPDSYTRPAGFTLESWHKKALKNAEKLTW